MSNELANYTNANPNKLPEKSTTAEQQIEKALFAQKVLDMNEIKQETFVIMCLRQAVILTQRKLSEERINVYCDELIKDIKRNFNWITCEELKLAIENGSKGIYGEVYELSYTQVFTWLKSYRDSEERRSVVERITKLREQEAQQKQLQAPAPQTVEEYNKEMAQIGWDIYKVKRNFLLIPEQAFFHLEDSGKMVMTKEEKLKELEHVKRYVMSAKDGDELFDVLRAADLKTLSRRWCAGKYYESLIENKNEYV